jgi:hypothetical protein
MHGRYDRLLRCTLYFRDGSKPEVWALPLCVRSTLSKRTLRDGTLGAPSAESRMGAVARAMRQGSVSHPRSSNRTCGFPASGSPTGFVLRHTKQSTDRKRHLRGVLSPGFNRHTTLSNSPSATGSIDTLRVDSSSTDHSRLRGALPGSDIRASYSITSSARGEKSRRDVERRFHSSPPGVLNFADLTGPSARPGALWHLSNLSYRNPRRTTHKPVAGGNRPLRICLPRANSLRG